MYKVLCRAKGGPRQVMASGDEILDCWMDHFRNLLNCPLPSSEELGITAHLTDESPVDEDAANNLIMEAEGHTALKSMKKKTMHQVSAALWLSC